MTESRTTTRPTDIDTPAPHAARRDLDQVARSFDTAMLVTRTRSGELRSRPMQIASHSTSDTTTTGAMTFVASNHGGLSDEIRSAPQVNVALQGDDRFASISGRAEPSHDRLRIHELWRPEWKAWFPEGPEDSEVVLVEVTPEQGEVWEVDEGGAVGALLELGRALVGGDSPSVGGSHAKVDL